MIQGARWRVGEILLVSLAITYLSSYVLLSASGRYRDNLSVLDDFGPPCLCISSCEQWQPALIRAANSPEELGVAPLLIVNGLGSFYLPLVHLDQKYWHKNRHLSDNRSSV
jgi:hypothetical protein